MKYLDDYAFNPSISVINNCNEEVKWNDVYIGQANNIETYAFPNRIDSVKFIILFHSMNNTIEMLSEFSNLRKSGNTEHGTLSIGNVYKEKGELIIWSFNS